MDASDEVIHLKHDLASQRARARHQAAQVSELLEIALEALEVDRPHVAKEKIEYAQDQLKKICPIDLTNQ